MIRWKHIWLLALAIKVLLAAILPLSNDEAYYWVWSHHLQWSYYDHPAGVAWLFWLGHAFEPLRHILNGFDFSGVVRIPAVIAGHLSLLVIKRLIDECAGDAISEKQHIQWLTVVVLSPFLGIGSLVITPDVPLVLMWSLSLLAFRRHLDHPTLKSAALFGAALGVGFCGKYLIVIFVPIALLYVVFYRHWKAIKPLPLLMVVFSGLIFSAPVWGWNAAHDWVSFRFQLGHGLTQEAQTWSHKLMQLGDYTGAQLGLLSPLVVFTLWKFGEPKRLSFLRWFGWGPILFFAYTSLRSPVEANWPIAGHMPLLILASLNDTKRYLSRGMIALWSVASLVVIYQTLNPTQDLFGIKAETLKTYEFVRFKELEPIAKEDPLLYASSYQMAGALSIAAERTVPKLTGLNRKDFFDFHESGLPQTNSFTVALDEDRPWPEWIKERGYQETSRRSTGHFTLVSFSRKVSE